MSEAAAPLALRLLRQFRLGFHFLRGLATATIMLPFCGPAWRDRLIRDWSRQALAILRVRTHIAGTPPDPAHGGVVFVANHISWLDVGLINSVRACRFVAKSEVRGWPLMGWLVARSGTLFIQRQRRHHTAVLNRQMAAALAEGDCIALFPEGTTSDGRQVRRFFSSLLQPAADTGAPLVPVAIRYAARDGKPDLAPAFIDDMTLPQSIARIFRAGEIRAELTYLPPIDTRGKSRREITHAAQEAIAAALNLPSPGTTPETAPDPPAA